MYNIGQVSQMFDIPVSTLRYYDKENLFTEIPRKSGIRKFSPTDLNRLQIIQCLKKSGLKISQIREYMNLCAQGSRSYQQRKDIFVQQKGCGGRNQTLKSHFRYAELQMLVL